MSYDTGAGKGRELPPRTRRIQSFRRSVALRCGTTSAHAENTTSRERASTHAGNYLRARGEYTASTTMTSHTWELPPRTRRIQ